MELKYYSYEELQALSIEQLEALAIELEKRRNKRCYYTKGFNNHNIENILDIRKFKLNSTFEWTPGHIEKMLLLNQTIMESFDKLRDRTLMITADLDKQLSNKDTFLNDYEVESYLVPFTLFPNEDGILGEPDDGIYDVLSGFHNDKKQWKHFLSLHSQDSMKDYNYNDAETLGKGYTFFANYFICHGIHELCSHSCYSFQDIMKINEFWIEVNVRHQHFVELWR